MKHLYIIRYVTNTKPMHEIRADEMTYSGGDSDTVVAFYAVVEGVRELIGVLSMQAGMIVEKRINETGQPAPVPR